MFDLAKIEEVRIIGNQILAECFAKQYPIALSLVAVGLHCEKHGVPLPEDALAWLSCGVVSDSMITNPFSVDGR